MTPIIQIADASHYVDHEVTLQGWLYSKTGKGKLHFLKIRDGSGIIQAVAYRDDLPEDLFEIAKGLSQESSLRVTGKIRHDERAPGYPGGYELSLTHIELIQTTTDYPITPKEHGVEFLMDHRHLWLRSTRQWAILRIRATVISTIRNWLDQHGYLLVDTPILSALAGENSTDLFQVDYFGEPAYLAQTGQLYNEANMMSFGKVYCFGPTFRAEMSKTRRHLIEFWMVEPEMAFFNLEDLMEMEEQFVSAIVQNVLEKHKMELEILERDTSHLERVLPPFGRLSYDDAVAKLHELHAQTDDPEQKEFLKIEWGQDFGSPHETALANLYDRPVFVYHYPTAVKAFYMQPVEGRPEVCRSVDLLAPEGYGEVTGGSERIYDPDLLGERVKEIGINPDHYHWYLDLRKYGSVPHAGFGLGVERTVAWICGLPHVRETIPYPRILNRLKP